MTDPVYKASLFWFLVTKASEIAYFFAPWILLAATVMWMLRLRSWPSYTGLAGGVLVAGAKLAHLTTPSVRSIGLGGLQPVAGESPVVYFFYMHGMTFGMLLLGVALVAQYIRRPAAA